LKEEADGLEMLIFLVKEEKHKNENLMNKIKLTFQFFVVLILFAGFHTVAMAQAENKFIRRGNKAFEEGEYKKAEIDYRKALEENLKSTKGQYNLGGAIYQQESYEDAANLFGSLTESDISSEDKARSFHNLGNSLMQLQKFDAAIESYKNALRNNPEDMDSKYNLEYAKKMLQQQQQQQEQDQEQDKQDQDKDQEQKEDQQKDQEQQDQEKQDQEKQNQEQKQDQKQNQDQQQNDQQQDQQQQQQQPKQISKEDAERMLQALKDNEKKTLEKLKLEKLKNARRVKSEKDW